MNDLASKPDTPLDESIHTLTYAGALARALSDAMADNAEVFVMGEDVAAPQKAGGGGVFGVTRGLLDMYGPQRVINTPISESAFLGQAVGAALRGLRPVVEIMFCDFLTVCMDPLVNHAAKVRFLSNGQRAMPLVVRTTMGAGDGSGAVHSQSLHGQLASIAGLRVAVPSTPQDAYDVMRAAILSDDPVVIFEHKGLYGQEGAVRVGGPVVPVGTPRLVRGGDQLTIVAFSGLVGQALEAARRLSAQGLDVEVIDPVWASPISSKAILKSVEKTGRLLVVDEGSAFAGLADAVVSHVSQQAFQHLKAAPIALTPPHTPVPYAREAEAAWLVSVEAIVSRALSALG